MSCEIHKIEYSKRDVGNGKFHSYCHICEEEKYSPFKEMAEKLLKENKLCKTKQEHLKQLYSR